MVQRAWQKIYNGIGGCISEGVDWFLNKYCDDIAKYPQAHLDPIDAKMVFDSSTKTKTSAGAMDGWMPKELSLLSMQTCGYIAVMLTQIEAGAPWPKSATHARIVYLEKIGA